MATTMFFEERVESAVPNDEEAFEIEFGRSSYTGDNRLYLVIDGKSVQFDHDQAKRFCEAVDSVASYLGYLRN